MPELAEVELARRLWIPAIGGILTSVETHPHARVFRDTPAHLIEATLNGSKLTSARAHGKRLLFQFERAEHRFPLEVHLGMSGRLELAPADHQARKHDHLILRLPSFALVYNDYRQFGRTHLHQSPDPWQDLPPEILSPKFTQKRLSAHLQKRPKTSLKALLLDQSVFPGIGNWMADEICWQLRRHPATPVAQLDPARLRLITRKVTQGALHYISDANETLITQKNTGFGPGHYVQAVPPTSWLFTHRWKKGGHCPRCQLELSRSTIATRTTAWCPQCQPYFKK